MVPFHFTPAEIIPLTAVGTLAVSYLAKLVELPFLRRQRDQQLRDQRAAAVDLRSREAAEACLTIIADLEQSLDHVLFGGLMPSDEEVELRISPVRRHRVYIIDADLRAWLVRFDVLIAEGHGAHSFGGPSEDRLRRALCNEGQARLGAYLRDEPLPQPTWATQVVADAEAAHEEFIAAMEETLAEREADAQRGAQVASERPDDPDN